MSVNPTAGAEFPLNLPRYGCSFGEAIRRFFKNYANFSGRASQSEYWFATLFNLLVYTLLTICSGGALIGAFSRAITSKSSSAGFGLGAIFLLVASGYSLAVLVPTVALCWRRLHDANQPGPLFFLSFVPFIGGLTWIVIGILTPKPEGARFDPDGGVLAAQHGLGYAAQPSWAPPTASPYGAAPPANPYGQTPPPANPYGQPPTA